MKLAVIGTGYLGATHAAAMAELGHQVVGVDVDQHKIAQLATGAAPFYEPGLAELLARHVATGRLRFATTIEQAADADLFFVCVGTPQSQGEYTADLSYLEAAFTAVAAVARRKAVAVGKSTVPVGTAQRLAHQLGDADVGLVWNPEFLREGFAVQDTLRPDRIVIGYADAAACALLQHAYAPITDTGVPVIRTNYATAELVKLAANAFLATKISFINAMADVCEVTGADVTQLAEAIGHDARIGHRFLRAGLGFGGGCLPKDIRSFIAQASELGLDQAAAFLTGVDAINLQRRTRILDLARELCDGRLVGRRAAVLGAAFKPDSDDVRDSPALDVACAIQRAGAAVSVYDPEAMTNAKDAQPTLGYAPSAIDACRDVDVVLHLTEWREFRDLRPDDLAAVVRQHNIIDGRCVLEPGIWRSAGWRFRAIGRPEGSIECRSLLAEVREQVNSAQPTP